MKLQDILSPNKIKLDVSSRTREEVITILVNLLSSSGDLNNPKEVKKMVLDREYQIGTGVGNEVAIPHCSAGPFPEPMVSFVRLVNGIDFHSPEKDKARLVFLLLTPDNSPSIHLRLMARICRITRPKRVREQLLNASSNALLLKVISEAEKNLPDLSFNCE